MGVSGGVNGQEAEPAELPKRKIGKTGVEMTVLEMGTGALREAGTLDRLLRQSFAHGVRMYDTANSYGSEPGFKKWFEAAPEVRKQIVLVTKDNPRTPKELLKMLDNRLDAARDRLRRLFLHPCARGRT